MRSIALALLLAALLVCYVTLRSVAADPLLFAPLAVLLGIAAASVLQGGVSWLAVGLGSLSALAAGWLQPWSPGLAMAVLCALWFAPKAWMSRTRVDLAVSAAAGLAAAALSAVVVVRYAQAPLALHVASCVFSGAALSMAALAGRADSPLLHALRVASKAARAPAQELLVRALSLVESAVEPRTGAWIRARGLRAGRVRAVIRAADRVIAAQGLAGDGADSERAELLERLRKAVDQLQGPGTDGAAAVESKTAAAKEPEATPAQAAGGDGSALELRVAEVAQGASQG